MSLRDLEFLTENQALAGECSYPNVGLLSNPFPNNKFYAFSNKDFADNNFQFDENGDDFSEMLENTVEIGEIAREEQFLYARRRRDVLWDHPWRPGRQAASPFFVRSISPRLC